MPDARCVCTVREAIVTYGALRTAGISRTRLRSQLAAGALQRVRRGVYARRGACPDAIAAAGHGGKLACVSAARHLGLWVLDDDTCVHVWLGAGGHGYHRDPTAESGCRCVPHWDDVAPVDSFGRGAVTRVLRQILRCRGVEEFFVALESARRLRMIDRNGLDWLWARTSPAGREAIALSRDDADSGLESLVRWRLRASRPSAGSTC
jgi:hypothetical protein